MSNTKGLKPGWQKGQSGNPAGKKPGTKNRATLLAAAVLERDVEDIAKVVTTSAKKGDLAACRMVLERIVPPQKERPISLELPDTSTSEGIAKAQALILQAVASGELLPGEGEALAAIVEQHRKAIETQELEQRIAALEAKK